MECMFIGYGVASGHFINRILQKQSVSKQQGICMICLMGTGVRILESCRGRLFKLLAENGFGQQVGKVNLMALLDASWAS